MIDRLSFLKTILWAFVGVLGAVTAVRFLRGLGAVTDLSDAAPWGLWIGLDVMAGVALAAGGFVLAAVVYIFHLENYRSFARPAILTALLGYLAVAVGLLYDLGLPWNIWHPMIYWQYHSVLFEVAACVMLYLTVLSLEFAPVVLEYPLFAHPLFERAYRLLKKATIPLVIAGIVLSTLHQASLGSLFLITPYRLHPLWYSPIIYVLFFVSAVGLGLMTVIMESLFAAYFLGHKIHVHLLSRLGLAAAGVLGLYALLRLGDLAVRGLLGSCLDGSWLGAWFLFELAISAVIPASLLMLKRVRSNLAGLGICAGLAIAGMVLYRLDVCIIAFARPEGVSYFPTWMELAVSLGIVSGGILIFLFFVERFRVYEGEDLAPASIKPSYDSATLHGLLPSDLASPRRYSLVAIAAAALAVLVLPVEGAKPVKTPIVGPRTFEGFAVARPDGRGHVLRLSKPAGGPSGDDPTRLLLIDGDRAGESVLFDHAAHVERSGGEGACAVCHHLNMPLDRDSSCWECHRDSYERTSLFSHDRHVAALGGNSGCARCHTDPSEVKTYETATACAECHEHQPVSDSVIPAPDRRWAPAASYTNAMHGLCISCHDKMVKQSPDRYSPTLSRCDTCHDTDRGLELGLMEPGGRTNNRPTSNQ